MPIEAHFEVNPAAAAYGSDRMRAPRRKLMLETQGSSAAGTEMPVLVHNFSETGLLLESTATLSIDETIELDLPEAGATPARVIWASGNLYGCAFDRVLPRSALSAAQLRSAVQPGIEVGGHSPANGSAPGSSYGFGQAAGTGNAPAAIGGESLGERLHRLRKERGLTQGELAARLGVSKPTVWAWEQGRARPIEDRLEAIARELGVATSELRPGRTVAGLPELIARCREQIAAAVETTPDKIKIMIEL
ncbi:helix-turn-helix domain-containing protein [Novosphingobium sp. BL-8A]|uniref:helix-turn-helix domain-containing protein n=1 Tax=Novosphingobium sp. BL-8A TaxID=3127639 RepID=UPI0037568EAB